MRAIHRIFIAARIIVGIVGCSAVGGVLVACRKLEVLVEAICLLIGAEEEKKQTSTTL